MNTSSNPDPRRIDPARLREAIAELEEVAVSYHETDPDRAAKLAILADDLNALAAWLETQRAS